ncbi:bifunctional 3-phenylpropionate/cinnamic acid dioxygenase ferredoxin subunit [Streptomyces sp. HNM0574]|uniref:bifunctional 3-phenylpropionate/cinnamic acid dioxygenase ferredoxin subunit n=1 Tax=Streptomyces sp. HNM0574 TaxID=2714954 RepID=UPI00146E9602|nr:bifunctional 3-phenylpropionate/cinnamic acid dioxygenase ferredoxin subunit [Streptomyces sp. HNM0574]NLU68370.1 bifunctional 3-phenylpropionate/cinnamic acid dioxygenase ferredoxin subunit [Streptomyces sp. HNM0574]
MITVCPLEDLPPGESVRVTEGVPVPVAVFNADGTLYAIDDTCTHQDASLSDGFLEGCFVECPLHEAFFDLRTGRPTCPPARKPVRTHEVSVADGHVMLHVTVREPA